MASGCLARRATRCDNRCHAGPTERNARRGPSQAGAALADAPMSVRREIMPNITIQWYAGRTDQQKREITAAITEAMVKIGKTTADQVQIVFQDVERSNWGVNGKLASDSK
jgi:4-oxalocrotonate tautomerase